MREARPFYIMISLPILIDEEVKLMVSWIELHALLTLVIAIIELVVLIYSGNKKN